MWSQVLLYRCYENYCTFYSKSKRKRRIQLKIMRVLFVAQKCMTMRCRYISSGSFLHSISIWCRKKVEILDMVSLNRSNNKSNTLDEVFHTNVYSREILFNYCLIVKTCTSPTKCSCVPCCSYITRGGRFSWLNWNICHLLFHVALWCLSLWVFLL